MKKLLIATTNPGKLHEIQQFLSEVPITCVSLKDMGITEYPKETGKTFEENAILKAEYYAKISGLPTIADDGRFEIDALGGEPGVKSHRWIHGDREDSDEELIAYTIKRMKGIPLPDRGAQLRAVIAFSLPGGETKTTTASIRGVIPLQPVFHYTEKRIRAHIFVCFLSLIVKWHILRTINPYSQEEGRRFLEEMEKLKAVAVDPAIPLFVRTEITETLRFGMGKLNMRLPEKVIVDGRKEKLIQEKHQGGRPKTDISNQTTLLDTI